MQAHKLQIKYTPFKLKAQSYIKCHCGNNGSIIFNNPIFIEEEAYEGKNAQGP